jgi:hypothetical protein
MHKRVRVKQFLSNNASGKSNFVGNLKPIKERRFFQFAKVVNGRFEHMHLAGGLPSSPSHACLRGVSQFATKSYQK